MLQLHVLGGFSAFDGSGASLSIARHRWALLAQVAAAGERGVSRDRVLARLWPEVPEDKARARLQQMLHAIRQSVDAHTFLPGEPLRLDPEVIRTDVADFYAAADEGDAERAIALYRGPFLDGFHLGLPPEFDEWLEAERSTLAGKRAALLERLAVTASGLRDGNAAVRWWRELATADPLNSRIARQLMEALAASGDRAGALQHAATHASLLDAELGVEPDASVTALAKTIGTKAPGPPHGQDALQHANALGAETSAPGQRARGVIPDTGVVPTPTNGTLSSFHEASHRKSPAAEIARAITWRRGLALAALGTVLAGSAIWWNGRRSTTPNAIAIAPFDTFDPAHELWRNGLVDVLSRNFDGTGPLRAIPASVVIARWKGRADSASARALAANVGAQLVVYGALVPSGRDSVRARAALLDATKGIVLAEVESFEALSRMDRVADSLSVRLLRALTTTRSLGLPRLASLGSGNPTAIKAFLRATQFGRNLRSDSALADYSVALEADSLFALAYLFRGENRWNTFGFIDSVAAADIFRAAVLNRGLARRDSLLIQMDSLWAAIQLGRLSRSALGRLFKHAEVAARLYPDDPQIMGAVGLVWYQYGSSYNIVDTRRRAVEAFRQATAADSNFIDGYYPLIWMFVDANDTTQLLGTIDVLLRRHTDPELLLTRKILRGERISEALADSFVLMRNAARPGGTLKVLADTGEMSLQLLRRRYASRAVLPMSRADSAMATIHLASALLRRGHWREALELPLTVGRQIAEPALLGVAPVDTAEMLLRRVVGPPGRRFAMLLPWLARQRDTLAIDSILRIVVDSSGPSTTRVTDQWKYFAVSAPAFRALAKTDTTSALRMLDAIPDSGCVYPACPYLYLERVRLARARRRFADAFAMSHLLPEFDIYGVGIAYVLERAHAAEALGKRAEAIHAFRHVLDSWKHADAEFRVFTDDAARGLRRVQ